MFIFPFSFSLQLEEIQKHTWYLWVQALVFIFVCFCLGGVFVCACLL